MTTWLQLLLIGTWLLTLAIALVLVIRPLTMRLFGSGPAYALWIIPGLVCCVAGFAPRPAGPRILTTGSLGSGEFNPPAIDAASESLTVLFVCWIIGFLISASLAYILQRSFSSRIGETIRVGCVENVPILISANLTAPIACGILNKRIVLPESFEKLYSAEVRQLILNHELVHLRRNDAVANLAAYTVCCLFWFHPLVHWAMHYFRMDQELSCDEKVLRSMPHQRSVYGNALLKAAVSNSHSSIGWLSSKAQVKQRIKALANPAKTREMRIAGLATVASVIVLASIVAQSLLPPNPPKQLNASAHSSLLEKMPKEELGQNLLHAIQNGDSTLTRRLLSSGAPIEYAKPGIGTPLILASKQGHFDLVKLLVESEANVNSAVLTAGSPLIMAAKYDHREIADFLIRHGSDVNAHVFLDETPLINAARFGHLDMVKRLVEAGAEVHKSVTTFSVTHLPLGTKSPLSEAERVGHGDIVSLLESLGS